MQHRGSCSAAPGCSLLDYASVANIGFCLPSPSFVSFGDREIFHIYFWLGLQLSLQTYHHPSPFSHAYTTVACLKAVLNCFIFSKAAIWRICIAVAVEQMIFAFFAGAVWPHYLLTLWWRKLVHYLTCSWWLIAVQEVWQSHLSLYCSFAEQPSHSRREDSASFIASQTVRFGFLSWYSMAFMKRESACTLFLGMLTTSVINSLWYISWVTEV